MGTSLGDQQLDFREPGNIGPVNIPQAVRLAAACWVASAVVAGMMPVILEVAGIDFGQSIPDWAVPYLVAFAVPLTALQVLAAQHLLHGARWARSLLTIAAALSALGAPVDLNALILAGLVLTLSGATLMWLPAANQFFLLRRNVPAYSVPAVAGPDPALEGELL
ncbi:hypothetical protein [Arthrobacter globiformis]|uniref:hypothetical protein n=1 Tax=Arthrobacter globiformis TaxID=1665 RepID=UPI00278DB7EB|nr:hypothetical protein [Arthrobacter globiformis]MDQ0620562.1 hypothetical protein [Arthrobacter globiformis]